MNRWLLVLLTVHLLAMVAGAQGIAPQTSPAPGARPSRARGAAKQVSPAARAAVLMSRYRVFPNLTYVTTGNQELKLDVYAPSDASGPVPVVMLIHGGGWAAGEKESAALGLLPYMERGWAGVNLEYRLARVAPAPAAVEDCRCALRWLARNARKYGFDTSRIILTGASAGGHLALMAAMLRSSDGLDRPCAPTAPDAKSVEGGEPEPSVAAVANWFGPSDLNALFESDQARGYAIGWLGAGQSTGKDAGKDASDGASKDRGELARRLSPLSYVRAGVPPIITIHGDADPLVSHEQITRFHAALKKAGVPNRLVTIHGGSHGGFNAEQDLAAWGAIFDFLAAAKVAEARRK